VFLVIVKVPTGRESVGRLLARLGRLLAQDALAALYVPAGDVHDERQDRLVLCARQLRLRDDDARSGAAALTHQLADLLADGVAAAAAGRDRHRVEHALQGVALEHVLDDRVLPPTAPRGEQ